MAGDFGNVYDGFGEEPTYPERDCVISLAEKESAKRHVLGSYFVLFNAVKLLYKKGNFVRRGILYTLSR